MGKFTGNTDQFDGKNPWVPVDFPLNQSIELTMLYHLVY